MLVPTALALRRAGITAIVAALLATLSDLTLLWVSYAGAGIPGLPAPPAGILLPATYVGALAILCYAVGYWQVACGLSAAGRRLARGVFLSGAAMAGVGAVIHGMTGLGLHYETSRGGDTSPAHAIATLLPLWLVGLACGGVSTVLYVQAVLRGPTAFPRWMALANPIVLPAAVAVASWFLGAQVRAFVVPAAPNIAHAIFFGLTTAALARGTAQDRADDSADAERSARAQAGGEEERRRARPSA